MLTQESRKASKIKISYVGKDFHIEPIVVKGYEHVLKIENKKTGLKAIIALHSLNLGPALGGTRIYPYASEKKALEDVLRLAKGMTYKAAIAEVGIGGGKSVIIADSKKKTKELLQSFGEAVEALQGVYIAAEDVGCSSHDAAEIRKKTKFVVGLHHENSSGNPAPYTAWGTFRGIQSVVKKRLGLSSLEGVKIAIQGLGSVGEVLVKRLFWAGAELIVSDIDTEKAKRIAKKYGATFVEPDEILSVECDVLSPCAMGGIINETSIASLKCKAIAGAANNQLLRDKDAELLKLRDILYAPDYVVNAGGLLNVVAETSPDGYDPKTPRNKTHQIYDTLLGIYEIAEKNNMTTVEAANALAEYRIQYGIGKRIVEPVFHHHANS